MCIEACPNADQRYNHARATAPYMVIQDRQFLKGALGIRAVSLSTVILPIVFLLNKIVCPVTLKRINGHLP